MKIRIWTACLLAAVLFLYPCAARAADSISDEDVQRIAQALYGECRADDVPTAQKAAVVWCILNWLDSEAFPDAIENVVVHSQFHGYDEDHSVWEELERVTRDVIARWRLEKQGVKGVGRTLSVDYYYFSADGHGNKFRKNYEDRVYWDWSLQDPYEFGMIQECAREAKEETEAETLSVRECIR